MKNELNRNYIFLVLLACFGLWGLAKLGNFLPGILFSTNSTNHYRKQLEKQEQEVWNGLATFGITQEKVNQLRQQDYAIFLQMCDRPYSQPISNKIRAIAEPIFEEFGVDIGQIQLIQWDRHPACASDTKMYINENQLLALSRDTCAFTIAHELQHIMHRDHSTDFFITGMLPENERGFDQSYDHPMLKYYRFRELRADLLVALKSTTWAQRYMTCMQEMRQLMNGNTNGPMHPKTSDRIKLAQAIVDKKVSRLVV